MLLFDFDAFISDFTRVFKKLQRQIDTFKLDFPVVCLHPTILWIFQVRSTSFTFSTFSTFS
eukprot:14785.XXX_641203_641385_1 [CDS] Oithona nana genome sequencing.